MEISIAEAKEHIVEIIDWLKNIKTETNCRGVVIGLSGGKDSTTVAMLAKKVWGDNVMALLMPNGFQKDLDDAINIATTLKIQYKIIDIGKIYNAAIDSIEIIHEMDSNGLDCPIETGIVLDDKTKTNIPSRIRMTVLYAVAQSLGYRVIGTGNYSEAFLGWCTKWGDTAYDFNPIGYLTCSEVKAIGRVLAKEFNLPEEYIDKSPADGLTGKTDEENFGFTYDDLDNYILGNVPPVDYNLASRFEELYQNSEHKRTMPLCYVP